MIKEKKILGRTLGKVLCIAQGYTHAGTTLQTFFGFTLVSCQCFFSSKNTKLWTKQKQMETPNISFKCKDNWLPEENIWFNMLTLSNNTLYMFEKTVVKITLVHCWNHNWHYCFGSVTSFTSGTYFPVFSSQSLQSFALVESKLNGMHHKPAPTASHTGIVKGREQWEAFKWLTGWPLKNQRGGKSMAQPRFFQHPTHMTPDRLGSAQHSSLLDTMRQMQG